MSGSMTTEPNRLSQLFSRLERGEALRIGFVGGSITTGYAAPVPLQDGWAGILGRWWQAEAERHGGTVELFKRGVSGTDSAAAAMRLQSHVLDANLDLVMLEFAINDQWLDADIRRQSFEGCLRQLLARPGLAVLALFLNERAQADRGQAAEQSILCDWYGVPWLRFSDHFEGDWNQLYPEADPIHPNGEGHRQIAATLVHWLGRLRQARRQTPVLSPPILPLPLYSSDFQFVRMDDSASLAPLSNHGFASGSDQHGEWLAHGGIPRGWHSEQDNAEMVLPFRGKVAAVFHSESEHYRNLEAWIDDDPDHTILQGQVASRSGYLGWAVKILARDLDDGEHLLHVRMRDDEWRGSGQPAHLCAVFAAGVCDSGRSFLPAVAPATTELRLAARDPAWQITGRLDPGQPELAGIAWQATSLSLRFRGTGLTLEWAQATDRNWFAVTIDGRTRLLELPAGGRQFFRLTDSLPDGEHELAITKRSEGAFGHASLAAVWFPAGGLVVPALPDRRPLIEFYGDSITAGACIEDGGTDQYDTLAPHDNLISYGAIAARRLGLRYANYAVSGTGYTCSWNPIILPEVFDRWRPDPSAAACPISALDPQDIPAIVVVNLGQNDYGFPQSTGQPLSAEYQPKMVAFLKALRQRYPAAWLVCAIGGMTAIHESKELRGAFEAAVAELQATDPRLRAMIFQVASPAHPRFDIHARMAEELVAFLIQEGIASPPS